MTKTLTITITIILLCAIAVPACASLYPTVCVVTDLDYENDLVIIEDCTGNLWVFEGIEDWDLGDIVGLIMNDMETPTIEDDEIVMMRYCGYMPEEK